MKILFAGDSITDGLRCKDPARVWDGNHRIGHSYAYVINALLGAAYPERVYNFFNLGVSGYRIADIEKNCLENIVSASPDILSLLVGVNDGPINGKNQTEPEDFINIYRRVLERVKLSCPGTHIIVCEPFVGCAGRRRVDHSVWQQLIGAYAAGLRKLTCEFEAVFVPLQDEFDRMMSSGEPEYWLWDGVHPTENGHGLIARRWLNVFFSLTHEKERRIFF